MRQCEARAHLGMSSSRGCHPFRFIALKNICSLGYTHVPFAPRWCSGTASGVAMGIVDRTRFVGRGILCDAGWAREGGGHDQSAGGAGKQVDVRRSHRGTRKRRRREIAAPHQATHSQGFGVLLYERVGAAASLISVREASAHLCPGALAFLGSSILFSGLVADAPGPVGHDCAPAPAPRRGTRWAARLDW